MLSTPSQAHRLLWRLLILAAAISGATLLAVALWIIPSAAIDIGGLDMNVVFSLQRMLLGFPLYEAPDAPPFTVTQYSPLFYFVVYPVLKLSGIAASDAIAITTIARGVAVLIAFLIAVLCYRFLRDRVDASAPLAFVATVAVMLATANWYFSARPDGLATLFTLLSFYIITGERSDTRTLAAVFLCCGAAFLSKQTGVFSFLVIFAWLIATRQTRLLVRAGVASLVVGLITMAILLSLGPHVKANLVDGVNNGITVRASLLLAYRPFFYWFAPVIAAALAASLVSFRPGARRIETFLPVAVILSLVTSILFALKRGAAENYFNEFVILATFAIVLAYGGSGTSAHSDSWSRDTRVSLAAGIYLLMFLTIRTGYEVYVTYLYHRVDQSTRLWSQVGPMNFVRSSIDSGRTAIGFGVGLSNMLPERMQVPEPEIAMHSNWRGIISYDRFREDVASGKLQFVIAKNDAALEPFLNAKFDDFVPVRRFNHYTVYESPR